MMVIAATGTTFSFFLSSKSEVTILELLVSSSKADWADVASLEAVGFLEIRLLLPE